MSIDTERRSKAALQAVLRSGLISKRARQVYFLHYYNGELTKREMYERFKIGFPDSKAQVDSFSPRYVQLVESGLMTEVGEKVCGITGRTVTAWDVTTKVPTEKLKALKKNEQNSRVWLRNRIEELTNQVAALQEENRNLILESKDDRVRQEELF